MSYHKVLDLCPISTGKKIRRDLETSFINTLKSVVPFPIEVLSVNTSTNIPTEHNYQFNFFSIVKRTFEAIPVDIQARL